MCVGVTLKAKTQNGQDTVEIDEIVYVGNHMQHGGLCDRGSLHCN